MAYLRTFVLIRHEDVSGVSGTGPVAVGAQLPSGKVIMEWLRKTHSIGMYNSVDDLMAVHGHEGRTTIEWDLGARFEDQ